MSNKTFACEEQLKIQNQFLTPQGSLFNPNRVVNVRCTMFTTKLPCQRGRGRKRERERKKEKKRQREGDRNDVAYVIAMRLSRYRSPLWG